MPDSGWFGRHRGLLLRLLIVLLLLVAAAESFLLYQQRAVNRAAQTQSAKLLTTFLQGDTAQVPITSGVRIRLQNVQFKWSDKVYVDADNIALRAAPLEGTTVNFDDLSSFVMTLQQSTVMLRPDVLAGMLNESVFNYPESKLRDLKVTLTKEEKQDSTYSVNLAGSVKIVLWMHFTMVTHLLVDTQTNTLVIQVDHLKLFGFIPATRFTRWTPFHLDRLIAMPPNNSLMVDRNRILVKPFALFPPPRINGKLSRVTVDDKVIRLSFAGEPIAAPTSTDKNYVYLRGGSSQFGHFRMYDTDVLIVDKDPSDPFVFSLLHYAEMIPKSETLVPDTKSVRLTMPDF